MPWMLYRYMAGEVLRVAAITAAVLVIVIAFGATIKPLAGGMLAPGDIAKYVALAIVPMLQFALPFAAGFASTIVLHRLVSDNEILAMAVGGLSYRRILLPIVALGAGLTITLLVLVYFVIPHFWVLMQRTVEQDVTRLLEASVRKGEAFSLSREFQVYAEEMRLVTDPQEIDDGRMSAGAVGDDREFLRPQKRLWLGRVAAVQLDEEGRIEKDVTARAAAVDFYERDDRTWVTMTMYDGYYFDVASDRRMLLGFEDDVQTTDPIPLPSSIQDEPKFMSLPRLLWIRDHPDAYGKIIREKQDLAAALQVEHVWREIESRIDAESSVSFINAEEEERYVIRAERFRGRVLTQAAAADVQVEFHADGELIRRIACTSASLELDRRAGSMEFTITLEDCEIFDPRTGSQLYTQSRYVIFDALLADYRPRAYADMQSFDLLRLAQEIERDRLVRVESAQLAEELYDLHCETAARIAHRTALSVTGFLLFALGAVLALKLRETLPLTIYLLAFLPAIGDILLISGGEQMMRDHALLGGFIVMWSGNIALLLIALLTYVRLARH